MIEIDSGYLRGVGIVCPTHKLEIKERKMSEIEKTEGEIKVLQAKLELLKEMKKHKSPCREAYKEVYGCYPPTTPSVSNSEDERWSAFQQGYNASKEECKVEEEPKPPTLLDIVYEWCDDDNDLPCEELVNRIKKWLPDEIYIEYGGAYERGWNDALRSIKEKLR
jgi:hypothetical protein